MSTTVLDVLKIIVEDQRHYFKFDEKVTLREIYSFGFWIRIEERDRPYFGYVFRCNCNQLGFRFVGKRNGICTYQRIK